MQFRTCKNHHTGARRAVRTVTLLDPVYRTGLLEVPLEMTVPTKGRDEWLEGRLNKDLSLCCLFQKGRCHAQERCFQVHVDRDFMTALRDQQSRIVSCCRNCADTASASAQATAFFAAHMPTATSIEVAYPNGTTRTIDANSVAFSAGLVQQFEEHGAVVSQDGVLVVPSRRICRLHMRGGCKYGKDCKNVHACCKFGEAFLEAPRTATVAAPAAAALPTPAIKAQPRVAVDQPKPRTAATQQLNVAVPSMATTAVASPPMTSFAPVPVASNPLGFGIAERNNNAKSMSMKSLDAVDFCENSARQLKSFLFDAAVALEDSALRSSGLDASLGNSTDDASSLMAAYSPGQKRRVVNNIHAMRLDAMHPCSQASDQLTACRVSQWDQWNMMSLFA